MKNNNEFIINTEDHPKTIIHFKSEPFNMTFHGPEGKEIGKFFQSENNKLDFIGDTEESGKVFINFMKQYWDEHHSK